MYHGTAIIILKYILTMWANNVKKDFMKHIYLKYCKYIR